MFKSSENLRLAAEMRALQRVASPWRESRGSWFDGTPESIEARLAATDRVLSYARSGFTAAHLDLTTEADAARRELLAAKHRLLVDFLDDGARAFKGSKRVAGDGMSYDETMSHIDQVLAEGEEHGLHNNADLIQEDYDGDCPHCRSRNINEINFGKPGDFECYDCGQEFDTSDVHHLGSRRVAGEPKRVRESHPPCPRCGDPTDEPGILSAPRGRGSENPLCEKCLSDDNDFDNYARQEGFNLNWDDEFGDNDPRIKGANRRSANSPLAHPDISFGNTIRYPGDKENNRFTLQQFRDVGPDETEEDRRQNPSVGIFNHDASEMLTNDGRHHWASRTAGSVPSLDVGGLADPDAAAFVTGPTEFNGGTLSTSASIPGLLADLAQNGSNITGQEETPAFNPGPRVGGRHDPDPDRPWERTVHDEPYWSMLPTPDFGGLPPGVVHPSVADGDYEGRHRVGGREEYDEGLENLSRYLGDRLLNPQQYARTYRDEDGNPGLPGGWPKELAQHLQGPNANYNAGYAASGHMPYLEHEEPWDAAGSDYYRARNRNPEDKSSFDDGWIDYASEIPHRYNDPEGHAAYHAEMNAPRQASLRHAGMEVVTASLAPLTPRCFYCDTPLTDETAKIMLPGGKIYGECCADLRGPRSGRNRTSATLPDFDDQLLYGD